MVSVYGTLRCKSGLYRESQIDSAIVLPKVYVSFDAAEKYT